MYILRIREQIMLLVINKGQKYTLNYRQAYLIRILYLHLSTASTTPRKERDSHLTPEMYASL
jgi:hypothetical protein